MCLLSTRPIHWMTNWTVLCIFFFFFYFHFSICVIAFVANSILFKRMSASEWNENTKNIVKKVKSKMRGKKEMWIKALLYVQHLPHLCRSSSKLTFLMNRLTLFLCAFFSSPNGLSLRTYFSGMFFFSFSSFWFVRSVRCPQSNNNNGQTVWHFLLNILKRHYHDYYS